MASWRARHSQGPRSSAPQNHFEWKGLAKALGLPMLGLPMLGLAVAISVAGQPLSADAADRPVVATMLSQVPQEPAEKKYNLKHVRRVVLDPGHGGDNLGALGSAGIREKVLCLDVAKRAAAWLTAHSDVEVLLTRERDSAVELRQRPRLANDWRADALISIHANAHETGEASGMEVFFLAPEASAEATKLLVEREEGIRPADATAGLSWSVGGILSDLDLAAQHRRSEQLALALGEALKFTRPAARFRGVRQAPFGVLKEARMAAVVLEIGYLTHPVEAPELTNPATQDQFGRAMLRALIALDKQLGVEAQRLGQPPRQAQGKPKRGARGR